MHSLQLTALAMRIPLTPLALIRHAEPAAATQTWQTKSMRQPLETTRAGFVCRESREHGRARLCWPCGCQAGRQAPRWHHLATRQLCGELCMATALYTSPQHTHTLIHKLVPCHALLWLLAAHNVAYEQRTRIRRAETTHTHAHWNGRVCVRALPDIAIATLTTCAHAPPA